MNWLKIGLLVLLMGAPSVHAQSMRAAGRYITVFQMRDGTTVEGRYVRQIPAGYIIQTKDGKRILVDSDQVRRRSRRWVTERATPVAPTPPKRKPPVIQKPPSKPLGTFIGKTRLDLSTGFLANACLGFMDVKCNGRKASVAGEFTVGVQIHKETMLGLDLAYGALQSPFDLSQSPGASQSLTTLQVMPTLRYFHELDRIRLVVGVGIGYGVLNYNIAYASIGGENLYDRREEAGVTVKALAEVYGRITTNIAVGLRLTYIYQGILSSCRDANFPGSANDVDDCNQEVFGAGTTATQQTALGLFQAGIVSTFSFGL